MSPKPFVGGNWKSNGSVESIKKLAPALVAGEATYNKDAVDVVIASTAIHLPLAMEQFKGSNIQISAQNCSKTGPGAYTGEITAEMIKDAGLNWTILGHSERRHLFNETNEDLAAKVAKAEAAGLKIIFCIGELLEEREAGKTEEVCATQMDAIVPVVKDWNNIVIAYEPVWAIGTGKVATTEQAQETHASIRAYLKSKVSTEVAESTRILYGGSVNPGNCGELIKCADVDGFLVGGASLKPQFTDIIAAAAQSA
ncbi:triose-phosphate isomerase 1, putative [Perkinsus marinus ATCC 50983]|uniref:Triosephosphate isomerase n=1 Tax=Perkinsus marinus (strain ATCC 50983 / TXsc) TaxID=423536 RepID=C5KK87_PERM5|nr:triose-phosphate isomerase 1, putative [Perkinsus marinus ATCC 50983]EER14999.1 triose-phosphate isomerase 1, putative [Perkinsus marinus ATCC 50983]|eukprot:XP_002783203.1 triose-phosphate isomerase 1, putative [Perkinsus marinus ATCC 50983]